MADFQVTAKARVARTFQNIRLFSGMTVLENLLVAQHNMLMKASGMSVAGCLAFPHYTRAERRRREGAVMAQPRRPHDRADDPAGELPYGAQRRLEIAAPCAPSPVLLCLDEPAAGLNPREIAKLNDLLRIIRDDTNVDPAHRARHVGGDGDLRSRGGARIRPEDFRRHARSM